MATIEVVNLELQKSGIFLYIERVEAAVIENTLQLLPFNQKVNLTVLDVEICIAAVKWFCISVRMPK
jgi:hypothetical protein